MLLRSRVAIALLCVASGASTHHHHGPAAVENARPRVVPVDASAQLAEGMLRFSTTVIEALNDPSAVPPPSNSYSHQRFVGPKMRHGEPHVHLEAAEAHSILASTDCSGWLSFLLNTVSPLHESILQSERSRDEYNHVYSEDFVLREGQRPWARAFVVTHFLRSDHAEATGFEPVPNFEELKPGDIGAYAMGRYAKPSDENRPKPRDTGHVFVVAGPPTVVDPTTEGYDGRGTLQEGVAKVIAVPVVDSSATHHFDPDSRKNGEGRYVLPDFRPHSRARAGGVGIGTIWFALSEEGRVLQRRLGPQQKYRPVLARAARLRGRIILDEAILDEEGTLLVRAFESSPSEFAAVSYGDAPIHLTGEGGIRLASGRLVLQGENDFSGGVIVESGSLIAASPTALGSGDVAVRGGTMTLRQPALANSATLRIAEELAEGAIRLEFDGRNVVTALQIGETTHRCGTWGGPGSRATFVHAAFSGPGVLKIGDDGTGVCAQAREGTPGADARIN